MLAVNGKQIFLNLSPSQIHICNIHFVTNKISNIILIVFISTGNGRFVFSLHIVEKLLEVVAVVAHPQAIYIALKQSGLVDFSQYSSSSHFYCFALKQSNRCLSGMLPTFLQNRST